MNTGDDSGPMPIDQPVTAPSSRRPFSTAQLLKALDATSVPARTTDEDVQSIAGPSPTLPAPIVPVRRLRPTKIKPPKDSSVYKIAMGAIALRAQGIHGQEIAEKLGVSYLTMKTYIHRATKRGWLTFNSFDDHEDKVEYVLADKAIRNANEMLDSEDTNIRKEMTIETLKGTGVFKQHQAVKVDNTTNVGLALKVQVEMPTFVGTLPTVRAGSVGGAAGVSIPVDAEIVEEGVPCGK
jgi:transposase